MSSAKPGRNDPCPCGSGKKYKACHAAEDRTRPAAAAPAHPLAADLQAAMALLGEEDTTQLSRALDRLEALLREWGPAPGLRFDAAAFDAHLSQALEPLAPTIEQDPARARRELFSGAAAALASRAFLDNFRVALLSRAAEPSRTPEERQALCVGALLASATPKTGRLRVEDSPVVEVLFDVQFREWLARQSGAVGKLEALVGPQGGDVESLVQHVEAHPPLAQRIAQEARERADRVEEKLREPLTPSVFAPEEELWLTVTLWEPLRGVKAPSDNPEARREAVHRLIQAVRDALDKDFLDGMLARLRSQGRDAALDEATRAFFTDAAIAFEAEPVRMVMAALFTARQEARGRSAEEMVQLADLKARPRWTPEDFGAYRQLLEQQGLTAAAARLGKAQEWLRSHPVSLPPEPAPEPKP